MSNEMVFGVCAVSFMLLFVVLCADLYVMYGIRNALFRLLETTDDDENQKEDSDEVQQQEQRQ